MSGHRRADWCHECGQPWPCPTKRAEQQAARRRCAWLVESSDRFCSRYAIDHLDGYCRAHWRRLNPT